MSIEEKIRNLQAWWDYSFRQPQESLAPKLRRECRAFRWIVYLIAFDGAFLISLLLWIGVRHK